MAGITYIGLTLAVLKQKIINKYCFQKLKRGHKLIAVSLFVFNTPIFQISALSWQVYALHPIKTVKHYNDTIGITALSCNCVYFTIILHNKADAVEF